MCFLNLCLWVYLTSFLASIVVVTVSPTLFSSSLFHVPSPALELILRSDGGWWAALVQQDWVKMGNRCSSLQMLAWSLMLLIPLRKKNSFAMFAARSSPHTNKFFRGQVVPLWSVNHDDISQVVAFISFIVCCLLSFYYFTVLTIIFWVLSKNRSD